MTFDWKHYGHLAEELANNVSGPASEEARQRSAISRAYYAVLCYSRDVLIVKFGCDKNLDFNPIHQQVPKLVSKHISPKAAKNIERLRKDRRTADYESEIKENVKSMTMKALTVCRNVLAELGSTTSTH